MPRKKFAELPQPTLPEILRFLEEKGIEYSDLLDKKHDEVLKGEFGRFELVHEDCPQGRREYVFQFGQVLVMFAVPYDSWNGEYWDDCEPIVVKRKRVTKYVYE